MSYLNTPCRSLMYLIESLRISDLLSFLSSGCVGSNLRNSANAPLTCCWRNRSLVKWKFLPLVSREILSLLLLPVIARTLSNPVKREAIWSVDIRKRVRQRARVGQSVARRSENDSNDKTHFSFKQCGILRSHISAGGGGSGSDDRAAGMTLMAGPTDDTPVLVSMPPPWRWSDLAAVETLPLAAVGDKGSPSVSESL